MGKSTIKSEIKHKDFQASFADFTTVNLDFNYNQLIGTAIKYDDNFYYHPYALAYLEDNRIGIKTLNNDTGTTRTAYFRVFYI